MPIRFELDRSQLLVRSWAEGVVTDQELSDHLNDMRALFEEGTLDGRWAQVANFCGVERFAVSARRMEQQALFNPWPAGCPRAMVMVSEEGFGLARMYELLNGEKGINIEIFRSDPEALAWVLRQRIEPGRPAG